MSKPPEQNIDPIFVEALQKIPYPGFESDILKMGLVTHALLQPDGKAVIKLRPLAAPPGVREELENQIAAAVAGLPGVRELELDLPQPPPPKAKEAPGPQPIQGVKAVVPVASGKGGVGKSTLAVNLALGLKEQGLKVGLLDLDLYGPSIPIMMGIQDASPQAQGEMLLPLQVTGIKVLSIGVLIGAGQALIWRGPLVMKAVRQLLHEVAWGPLDVLVIDLPPGTGDIQISLVQDVPITGAVVVTTPQDVALADVRKAVDMFKQVGSKVLGVVENMSFFTCPDCGARHEIFGHGTVEPLTRSLGVDFLGEIPLDPAVPSLADTGRAALTDAPGSAEAYRSLAHRIKDKLKDALEA